MGVKVLSFKEYAQNKVFFFLGVIRFGCVLIPPFRKGGVGGIFKWAGRIPNPKKSPLALLQRGESFAVFPARRIVEKGKLVYARS
jgi:hypothetical protein